MANSWTSSSAAFCAGCDRAEPSYDVPYSVVINEYVELTKTFNKRCNKYVNGVSDRPAQDVRTIEVAANQRQTHPRICADRAAAGLVIGSQATTVFGPVTMRRLSRQPRAVPSGPRYATARRTLSAGGATTADWLSLADGVFLRFGGLGRSRVIVCFTFHRRILHAHAVPGLKGEL